MTTNFLSFPPGVVEQGGFSFGHRPSVAEIENLRNEARTYFRDHGADINNISFWTSGGGDATRVLFRAPILENSSDDLISHIYQVMHDVTKARPDIWRRCHWRVGFAFRATWYSVGIVISQTFLGSRIPVSEWPHGDERVEFEMACIPARCDRSVSSNTAVLMADEEPIARIVVRALPGFEHHPLHDIENGVSVVHSFLIPELQEIKA